MDNIFKRIGLPADLIRDLYDCKNCPLSEYRKFVVPGRGIVPADILLMGEAPGRVEDVLGLPFVGASGNLLRYMLRQSTRIALKNLNSTRFKMPSTFITNTVLCRPCDDLQSGNRKPLSSEVIACRNNLQKIITLVKPKQVIFIGKEAIRYYKDDFKEYTAIQHPAFLLRTGGRGSAWYNQNVVILSKVLENLIKENHDIH